MNSKFPNIFLLPTFIVIVSQTGIICLTWTKQIFAVLLPSYYIKMLEHIANRKQKITANDEKIEVNIQLLNELTSNKRFSFEGTLIKIIIIIDILELSKLNLKLESLTRSVRKKSSRLVSFTKATQIN